MDAGFGKALLIGIGMFALFALGAVMVVCGLAMWGFDSRLFSGHHALWLSFAGALLMAAVYAFLRFYRG